MHIPEGMRIFSCMNSWAYKIDYAAEIAADERQVRLYENPVLKALCATVTESEAVQIARGLHLQWIEMTVVAEPALRAQRMEILGLTEEELCAAYLAMNYGHEEPWEQAFPGAKYSWQLRTMGEAIYAFGERYLPFITDAQRKKYLSVAKADRARHIRNAKKNA